MIGWSLCECGSMRRTLLWVGVLLAALPATAWAQDKGSGSGVYTVLLDNERVRVLQGDFKPGDKAATRNYPNHLIYTLTDGTLVFVPAGRTGYEVNFKAGEAMWFPPLARATENDSGKDVRVLVVEFKDAPPAAPEKGKVKAKGKAKSKGEPKSKGKTKATAKKK